MPPLRPLIQQSRHFSTSPKPQGSVLFALGALSNSRETQHFNKISRLDRTEHSPSLKLIKTSEVDPWKPGQPRNASSFAAFSPEMERSMVLEQMVQELQTSVKDTQKRMTELRTALGFVLVAVGIASSLAVGSYAAKGSETTFQDSGDLGRRIAERAKAAIPLPSISAGRSEPLPAPFTMNTKEPTVKGEASLPLTAPTNFEATTPISSSTPSSKRQSPAPKPPQEVLSESRWWQNLFWRQ